MINLYMFLFFGLPIFSALRFIGFQAIQLASFHRSDKRRKTGCSTTSEDGSKALIVIYSSRFLGTSGSGLPSLLSFHAQLFLFPIAHSLSPGLFLTYLSLSTLQRFCLPHPQISQHLSTDFSVLQEYHFHRDIR